MLSVYSISQGDWLSEAAANQNTYRVEIAKLRGMIYDCRQTPLVGREKVNIAAVVPCIESTNALTQVLSGTEREDLLKLATNGSPFAFNLKEKEVSGEGIDLFKIPVRYEKRQLCEHVIGYLDGSGKGIAGIEKAYDEYLADTGAAVSVKYKVDALNRILEGDERVIDDRSYLMTKGVVLTIDSRIQEIAENAAEHHLKNGAVIVTEVPSCKIRAMVSLPSFSPNNVGKSLNDQNAPLMNRALSSYNIGSVFKLVVAAAALESEVSSDLNYDCKGALDIEGYEFHCFGGQAHGTVDMKNAIAHSCNTYFINLAQSIDPKQLLGMAKSLGFGNALELAPGLLSDEGNLPSEKHLIDKKARANFSFGQGSLLTTPIQISGLINTIASKGVYQPPKLVEGVVNENLEFIQKNNFPEGQKVISEQTAETLKEGMKASVEYGTSNKGKPEYVQAAEKTSTAETGLKIDGKPVDQAWCAGFYPADQPKYSIVILAENGVGGGESCGPVFKEIADEIYKKLPGALLP